MKVVIKDWLNDPEKRDQIYRVLLQLFLLCYTALFSRAANYSWIALMAFWLTEPQLLKKIRAAFNNKLFLLLMAFYLIHVLSLFYTDDLYVGIKKLETRISLFTFPLLLGTITLSKTTVYQILKCFIWACFLVAFVGLINSVMLFYKTNESVHLYSDNLVILIEGQAIYFALYLNIAILFIVYLLRNKALSGYQQKVFTFLFLPFFIVMIFLLAGRVSLIILALLLTAVIVAFILRRRMYLTGIGVIALLVIGAIVASIYFPKTIGRFKTLSYIQYEYGSMNVYHFNEEDFENKWNGLTIRLALWECTWELIAKQPLLGTGIGDYMDELRGKYQEKNFRLGLTRDLSPHNQYLLIWLSLGLAGFLVFILSIACPSIYAYKQRNYLYLAFMLMISINMFTEEILSVYRGVVFFSFFNSLLLFHLKHYPRDIA